METTVPLKPLAVTVPITFIDEYPLRYLAITKEDAFRILSLDRACSTKRGMDAAFRRICVRYKITKLPGNVYPFAQLEAAMRSPNWKKWR